MTGGCTGCGRFHDRLDAEFEEVTVHNTPRWYGLHDRLFVYRRK